MLVMRLVICIVVLSVLPSFSGNVPEALKKIHPLANISRLGDWYVSFSVCNFSSSEFDDLFTLILSSHASLVASDLGLVSSSFRCSFCEDATCSIFFFSI